MDASASAGSEDVLRVPTRARLFDVLRELKRPVATEELATRLGLHRSGVRVHLQRLEAAGLIERRRVRRPRGRPRDAWSISSRAEAWGQRPHAYAELAAWLAGAIPARAGRLREIESAGRRLGRELVSGEVDLPLDQRLQAVFAALGFQPRPRPASAADTMRFELGNCPYRAAARANQPVVCTLHRGLTRGLLDMLEPRGALRDFVPHDPDRAGCLIEIEGGYSSRSDTQEATS